MNWKMAYTEKYVSIEVAASKIEQGDRIWFGAGIAAPVQLMEALADRVDALRDVKLLSALALHGFKFLQSPDYVGRLSYYTVFQGAYERAFSHAGNVNVVVAHLSEVDKVIADFEINVLMADVSMPDEDGYMYYGPMGVVANHYAAKRSNKIIVQVNKHQPRAKGVQHRIHVNDVSWICEHDHTLATLPEIQITEVEKEIAEHVIPHIPDGATIQIGIGGLANAIGYRLDIKKELSVYTEMYTDSMLHLAKKGVLRGTAVAAFGLGCQELYDFIEEGGVEFAPAYEVNNPYRIGEKDNFISINACLMSDLTGQVCSESVGFKQFSTTGGQMDFVRGARLSKGGKSFLCLPSTHVDKNGTVSSTIVTALPAGQVVTSSRADVMNIVTEYGVANLKNKTIGERVDALIAIAHPDFRVKLREEATQAGLIKK